MSASIFSSAGRRRRGVAPGSQPALFAGNGLSQNGGDGNVRKLIVSNDGALWTPDTGFFVTRNANWQGKPAFGQGRLIVPGGQYFPGNYPSGFSVDGISFYPDPYWTGVAGRNLVDIVCGQWQDDNFYWLAIALDVNSTAQLQMSTDGVNWTTIATFDSQGSYPRQYPYCLAYDPASRQFFLLQTNKQSSSAAATFIVRAMNPTAGVSYSSIDIGSGGLGVGYAQMKVLAGRILVFRSADQIDSIRASDLAQRYTPFVIANAVYAGSCDFTRNDSTGRIMCGSNYYSDNLGSSWVMTNAIAYYGDGGNYNQNDYETVQTHCFHEGRFYSLRRRDVNGQPRTYYIVRSDNASGTNYGASYPSSTEKLSWMFPNPFRNGGKL